MFFASQVILDKLRPFGSNNVQTYSIAAGVILYASIYVYLLMKKSEYLDVFNKFLVYIIGIDLLMSAAYHFYRTKNKDKEEQKPLIETNAVEKSEESQDSEQSEESEESHHSEQSEESEEQVNNEEEQVNNEEEEVKLDENQEIELAQNEPEQHENNETPTTAQELPENYEREVDNSEGQENPPKRKRGRPPKVI